MEAFKITFIVTTPFGVRTTRKIKAFAPTGFEAAEKSKKFLLNGGYKNIEFLHWKVLNPFQAHFQ